MSGNHTSVYCCRSRRFISLRACRDSVGNEFVRAIPTAHLRKESRGFTIPIFGAVIALRLVCSLRGRLYSALGSSRFADLAEKATKFALKAIGYTNFWLTSHTRTQQDCARIFEFCDAKCIACEKTRECVALLLAIRLRRTRLNF